jgi:hypothetical protein
LFTPTTLLNKQNWGFENWIDGIFCTPKFFLKSINYTIDEINVPDKILISSGVGRQLTEKLNKFNIKVDFVGSIVEHNGNEDSKMHPILRKKEPLVGNIENVKLESKEIVELEKLPQENIIRQTLEKTTSKINYEKVNQIFNNAPSHKSIKPKTITGNSTLKTNSSMINKLILSKKRR